MGRVDKTRKRGLCQIKLVTGLTFRWIHVEREVNACLFHHLAFLTNNTWKVDFMSPLHHDLARGGYVPEPQKEEWVVPPARSTSSLHTRPGCM